MLWPGTIAARGRVIDAIEEATAYHLTDAMQPLRSRIEAACGEPMTLQRNIFAAPIARDVRSFKIVENGKPAILVAIPNEFADLEDMAAFAAEPPHDALRLTNRVPALGLDAWITARWRDDFRVRVHADIWSWLRAKGEGLLPLDWQATAFDILTRRPSALIAADETQGVELERRLTRALKLPPTFIAQRAAA